MEGRELAHRQPLATWLCCPLLLLLLMSGAEFDPAADGLAQVCETTYEGITYCVEDGGDVHVAIIDLDNPYVRFEMVMADDVTSVETNRRERVEDIVTRPPYLDQTVVVAVNADYFGRSHGPEGLTVKNGQRLDVREPLPTPSSGTSSQAVGPLESSDDDGSDGDSNPNAVWRSSLAISRLNRVSLGRKSATELSVPRAYRERFYNAVGGGPLILNYGVVIPNVVACQLERFPVGACRRKIQTAAGLSEDGRWLYLAVGQGRDIEGFARLLRDYGAFTAIKLDGGGSSQMWYAGSMRHDSDRSVGNALLVIHSPVPRHDARIVGPRYFPVVEPGERVGVDFEIQNTGFLDWEPDLGYRFKNVQGWPVLGPAYQRLPQPVSAGSSLAVSLTIVAPYRPGVYETEWQLTRRAETIGPRLWFGLVVVPPGSGESGLQEQIETQLARRRVGTGFEQEWPVLRRELESAIRREVEKELRTALCGGDGWAAIPGGAAMWAWWTPLLRLLAC